MGHFLAVLELAFITALCYFVNSKYVSL